MSVKDDIHAQTSFAVAVVLLVWISINAVPYVYA